MIRLERYLFTLLLEHDCVSIPGFGGLVAQRFRAEINPATNILRPPTKRISFHEGLAANANLLVDALAKGEKISREEAQKAIAQQVKNWQIDLATGASIKLDLIGRFYLDKQNAICFNQSLEANFDLDTFGLDIFRATAINRDTQVKAAVQTAITERVRKEVNKPLAYWRAAAAFVGIGALLTVGFFKSDVTFNQEFMATFNPLHFSRAIETPVLSPRKLASPVEISVPVVDSKKASETPDIVNQTEEATAVAPIEALVKPAATVLQYQVIVGSFKDVFNAQELILNLQRKGYNPEIINDGSPFTKVSIQGFSNRENAVSALKDYKSKVNRGAWIYTAK